MKKVQVWQLRSRSVIAYDGGDYILGFLLKCQCVHMHWSFVSVLLVIFHWSKYCIHILALKPCLPLPRFMLECYLTPRV